MDSRSIKGYRRLAEYMAWEPAVAMFPRFRAANMLNLLYLQAEIIDLTEKLNNKTNADDGSNDADFTQLSCDWSALKDSGPNGEQWKAYQNLKSKLAEYSKRNHIS
jgi:hypothetical protein